MESSLFNVKLQVLGDQSEPQELFNKTLKFGPPLNIEVQQVSVPLDTSFYDCVKWLMAIQDDILKESGVLS